MESATIKIFLVNGTPDGLRTAELSNWSGKAIAAPRTELSDLLKREEMKSPGIYFLTGVDPETGDNAIYVGEAENVAKRMRGHADKDFWNAISVFVSKDDNLTKAHIRYLEGKLIESISNNSSIVSVNAASSGSKLPESDAAEMNVFLAKVLQLLPVLGVNHFQKPVTEEKSQARLLYCKGLVAKGRRTSGGFLVFEGSQAVKEHLQSAKSMRVLREKLVLKGILAEGEDCYVFSQDYEFGSPSTAGSVVRGGNTNGLINWKDKQGQTLKEIEAV